MEPELYFVEKGSQFKMIDAIWSPLQGRRKPMHRICTLMRKMGVGAVLTEEPAGDFLAAKRIAIEREQLEQRLSGLPFEFKVQRLTFFHNLGLPIDLESKYKQQRSTALAALPAANNFVLGYVLIAQCKVNGVHYPYVLECVLREFGQLTKRASGEIEYIWPDNQFLHVKKKFKGEFLGCQYELHGTYFCQQNGITTVCANAAVAAIVNNVETGKELISPAQINDSVGIDHVKRRFRSKIKGIDNNRTTQLGLSEFEVDIILKEFELGVADRNVTHKDCREMIYGFIESGFPALLYTQDNRQGGSAMHVVSVLGHTLNSDSWLPFAFKPKTSATPEGTQEEQLKKPIPPGHLSTLAWVDNFIIHDDNHGPYFYLPAHSFTTGAYPNAESILTPLSVWGIHPKHYNISLFAEDLEAGAESLAGHCFQYLKQFFTASHSKYPYHLNRLDQIFHDALHWARHKEFIMRTLLVSSAQYLKHLSEADANSPGHSHEYIETIRDKIGNVENFWLVEVTEPNLYTGNSAKVFDMLIKPDYKREESGKKGDPKISIFKSLLCIRLPKMIAYSVLTKDEKEPDKINARLTHRAFHGDDYSYKRMLCNCNKMR